MGVMSSSGAAPGVPAIDQDRCLHCGKCASICPVEVLRDDGEIVANNAVNFGCIACGQCMMVCPNGSITVSGRGMSPDDVIDLPSEEQRATSEQLSALMLSRRSIRTFTDTPVSRDTIDRIVNTASSAPMGIPPWEVGVSVLLGRDKVAELSKDAANGYAGMLKVMDNGPVRGISRLVMKKTTFDRFDSFILPLGKAIVEGARAGKDLALYNAPAVLIFHYSPYADNTDAVIACTYAMLAAESEGLGTCMIGSVPPIIARSKALKEKYLIPIVHTPAVILIMGYHEHAHRKGIRRRFLTVERV